MQSIYSEILQRDMACTEADWLRWLPQAIGDRLFKLNPSRADVRIGDGALELTWQVAPQRVIGLVSMPRLLVNFRFAGVDAATRHGFMTRFDLYMQRGGG